MARKAFMVYVPEATAVTPLAGRCIVDHWWIVHPQHGLAFYEWGGDAPSPQCNSARGVVEPMTHEGRMHAGHMVKHFPVVFVGHAHRELRRLRESRTRTAAERGGDRGE